MRRVYTVLYINVDEPKNSEVLGVYETKSDAVNALIKAAHYENRNGVLYQYKRRSIDFESSYSKLLEQVNDLNLLEDVDIYRIEQVTDYSFLDSEHVKNHSSSSDSDSSDESSMSDSDKSRDESLLL